MGHSGDLNSYRGINGGGLLTGGSMFHRQYNIKNMARPATDMVNYSSK